MCETNQTLKLYSPFQVAISTFIGLPLAGSILMMRNFNRTNQKSFANQSLTIGIVATLILIPVVFYYESKGLGLFSVLGMYKYAAIFQKSMYNKHIEQGGDPETLLSALLVGIFCLIGIFCVMVIVGLIVGFENIGIT